MQYLTEATYGHAKFSCYRCEENRDGVDLDTSITGEGGLFICGSCLKEALQWLNVGRAQQARRRKATERREAKEAREAEAAREKAAATP